MHWNKVVLSCIFEGNKNLGDKVIYFSPSADIEPISTSPFPPVDQRGVPQPDISNKDIIIIIFMLGLWAYSIIITIRLVSSEIIRAH